MTAAPGLNRPTRILVELVGGVLGAAAVVGATVAVSVFVLGRRTATPH
ncbi:MULTISPECIES: hypothetical protein [unclassified Brevibacterium]|nr:MULTISPECIES: hypothetical protein [unclassified Brevibacterium]MCM1011383.1 hypothetical protein [Brevibacterium sp. XM4083]